MTTPTENRPRRLPLYWRGVRVGTLVDPEVDMYWWHARWEPRDCDEAKAFRALVEAGEDPEVLVGAEPQFRLHVTAAAGDELELKGR
ncbi:MAG: hypothetical protein WBV82_05920 [Myxococcaceae bacterium]